jgi:ornithine cyclodeaminase/alanine dehydrogenase-like protein (mu-crystallin family)
LPQKIGSVYQPTQIMAVVQSQLAQEASVAASPPPKIQVSADPNDAGLTTIAIAYTDAKTGVGVSFTMSG